MVVEVPSRPKGVRAPQRDLACHSDHMAPDRPREPPGRRIAADLRRRLAEGEWPPGRQLPSNADLAEHYGSTRRTVSRILAQLAAEGLVEIEPRWGTFAAHHGRKADKPPG
jgi:GntR family transcriptional regulator